MITDNMIRDAAIRSRKIFADKLESNYDSEHQHEPSPDFKRKIEKLQRRADHPLLYRPLCRIASIVLVLLISVVLCLLRMSKRERLSLDGLKKSMRHISFIGLKTVQAAILLAVITGQHGFLMAIPNLL